MSGTERPLNVTVLVEALQEGQLDKGPTEPPIAEPPTLWPLRSVNTGTRYH